MSQGPDEENPRIDEEVREAERQLGNLTGQSDDALTDEDARAPDDAPSEQDAGQASGQDADQSRTVRVRGDRQS
ncbi:hypothetical protein [Micromonospora sp. NBC_01638]|uniref:hypothetical protein n=1 Tax=Micromonospora sp. NBC_01638 TaxID=2975982 RepID=UPI00386BA056|nr:hypothetical protein OG811_20235 [Micromonospora sp. NBC_01638]